MDVFIGGGLFLGIISGLNRDVMYTFVGSLVLSLVTLGIHSYVLENYIPWWEYIRHWLCCIFFSESVGYFSLKWKREITMWIIVCVSAVCTWMAWTRPSSVPPEDDKPLAIAVEHPDGYICLGV